MIVSLDVIRLFAHFSSRALSYKYFVYITKCFAWYRLSCWTCPIHLRHIVYANDSLFFMQGRVQGKKKTWLLSRIPPSFLNTESCCFCDLAFCHRLHQQFFILCALNGLQVCCRNLWVGFLRVISPHQLHGVLGQLSKNEGAPKCL